MEHFKIPPARKILYSFREKEEVSKWRVFTDAEAIGGFSKGTFVFDEETNLETSKRDQDLIKTFYPKSASFLKENDEAEQKREAEEKARVEKISLLETGSGHFNGILSLELPLAREGTPAADRVEKSGFSHLKGPVDKLMNLQCYDGIEVRIKTDGRLYLAQIKLESEQQLFISAREDEIYQIIIPPCKPDTWTRVVLPFKDFILTWRGYQREQDTVLETDKIKSISFLMAERESGPYSFKIDWIHAVKFDGTDRFLPYRYKGESFVAPTKYEINQITEQLKKEKMKRRNELAMKQEAERFNKKE
jgi:hypothetical protein